MQMIPEITEYDLKLTVLGEPMAQQRHRSSMLPRRNAGVVVLVSPGYDANGSGIRFVGKDGRPAHVSGGETLYRKNDFWMHNYDPSATDKRDFLRLCAAAAPPKPFTGPLRVDLFLYFGYLKGHYGTGRNANKLKPNAPIWKDTGKDRDNCDKLVLDALTGKDALKGKFWLNDSQVCAGLILKLYDEKPRTEVYITKLSNGRENPPSQQQGNLF